MGFNASILAAQSNGLRDDVVFPGLANGFVSAADVGVALRSLAAAHPRRQRVRTMTNGKIDHALEEHILRHPPEPGQDLASWRAGIAASNICIVLNNIELHCPQLVAHVAPVMAALAAAGHVPAGGVDITTFIGDYGYTPFGIHRDEDTTAIVHFHVGPGDKTLWTWTRAGYRAAAGTDAFTPVPEPLLLTGRAFTLRPGDMMAMNGDGYHIGHSASLSATLGLRLLKLPAQDYIARAIAAMHADAPLPPEESFVDFADPSGAGAALPSEAILKAAPECFAKGLLSNLGFNTRPAKRRARPIQQDGAVRVVAPYPLQHAALSERTMWLFCRGYRLAMSPHTRIADALALLNRGETVSVATLTAMLMPEWTAAQTRIALSLLQTHSGIDAVV
jgi:hypothetical protein